MPLDHSKATVTISIAGIALSCINKLEGNRFEIGFLRCDRHRPLLDIQEIEFDPKTGESIRSCLIPHSLNLDEDITINAINGGGPQCGSRVSQYVRRAFDRLEDTGDEEDFRWIPDLEGPEFHGHKLTINHRSKLLPTLYLNDGILYTRQKTDEAFARVPVRGRSSKTALGKLAYGINADIICKDGGEVVLSNIARSGAPDGGSRCSVKLPKKERSRYLITIENHCQLADEIEGTDFQLFYEVVKDPAGKEFDLRRVVETGCYAAAKEPPEGRADFTLDGFPQNCLAGYLGETDSLNG
ncbi:MAG: hypothetical protein DMF61_23250 [Blastocatellia bacterium AA13]|nr:MAG: hypothetical protein DMF61_23250 [Blastocatellia bacterium AA13]